MKFPYEVVPALIGISIILVKTQVAVGLSSQEVAKIAKEITVLIASTNNPGSGVIIKRDGNTYTVITAAHVVAKPDNYAIVTSDSLRYQINYKTVKLLQDIDLAVVQFTSDINYKVAKIGNSDQSTEGTTAYVAGFPKATAVISRRVYNFVEGKISANASKALKKGYALVYSNDTLPGMSGGAVLNDKGELIGIHGRADTSTENLKISDINPNIAIKTGFNLGIPINTFLRLASNVGVKLGISAPPLVATAPKADDFFAQAGDKFRKGDYKGGIDDLNEAIRLNPNYAKAYYARSLIRVALSKNWQGKDWQGAIDDLSEVIKINPKYVAAYNTRAFFRMQLKDFQGAIADANQAIKINYNDLNAHKIKAISRLLQKDLPGAIADLNQVIKINPNDAGGYVGRGKVRTELKDFQGAITDFNQAIKIDSNNIYAYNGRGEARVKLQDWQGAIADFNQAIKINPNDAEAYSVRGLIHYALGDKQSGIADFNQAIKIKPNDPRGYVGLGVIRAGLGDKRGASAYFRKAANVEYQEAGDTELHQKILELIRQLQ
ncbi:tetratricopeptide repeat protein [Aetokthonos hydrillicola Thurmond2011]|uniref:Tetratricopeptide repeat protein n=1 Tax=Aetokthonos hydrillicola Thurmond2011 TaxID=2712845 RepID=A0AAP5IBV3_9CYAN|nr:serine protease [Aetokthonos hydrillicola]MBO3457143.1 tetratricopeptide repeat protein [Aetokthonos hydrillicola CCALA 1050]MBW4587489.1 tetratricopeptide repeat protein [Aetokthonos hydrillicola CCALA 1050]MDR9898646.1 tetratricopeptide repeat protein [Aetokthonos hydrillicola Thurmond2011]